jgi:hypothetical protein
MTRIAIHQPNYVPWLGYFAKMASADVFVFLDDAQMPGGQSYVSRVQIRRGEGGQWLTVPVRRIFGEPINSVWFADKKWPRKHIATLQATYSRCPFFSSIMDLILPIYEAPSEHLAAFNIRLISALASYVELFPRFFLSSQIGTQAIGTKRLIDIVARLGGTTYICGEGGTKYQDPELFKSSGIELDIRVYRPIRYQQIHGDFVPGLSILDALFHLGPDASSLLKYSSPTEPPAL